LSFFKFNKVEIKGISAVVPKRIVNNYEFTNLFDAKEIENTIKTTGVVSRRFVEKGVCSSDLCYQAAENLISEMNIDKNSIDVLIFLSQTPDYHQPATAPSLQHRLGLKKECASFDVNLACSGYVYGLSLAFLYANQDTVNNVLLLVGETLSKITSLEDKTTSLLFGDGGSATIIGKSEDNLKSYFSLNSDGSGKDVLMIKGGGYRNPSNKDTLKKREFNDGSMRSDEQMYMDGIEVFNFTMREVPRDIKQLLKYSNFEIDNIDYILFHQANKFMTDFFAKKLKYPLTQVPYSISEYGNTSAVSIPLTIVSKLNGLLENKTIIMSGYGAGLSWATSIHQLSNIYIGEVTDYVF
jgi:3-oxoacyl-[acyl-carrier-protein] synthase-3